MDHNIRLTKRDRKLQISYALEHRINTAQIYPFRAPNGSTLVIYGHQNGFRILWRGGRRSKSHSGSAAPRTNGTSHVETIVLDADDEPPQPQSQDLAVNFEEEEEELDPDCPYPSIIQELDIELDSAVTRIAVPALANSSITPTILRHDAVATLATASGRVIFAQVPLLPPVHEEDKERVRASVLSSMQDCQPAGRAPLDVAMKFLPIDNPPQHVRRDYQEGIEGYLLIASVSRTLNIWNIPVHATGVIADEVNLMRRTPLSSTLSRLSFHPSTRSAQIIIAEAMGAARIYDPYALNTPLQRPGSSDSTTVSGVPTGEPGKWLTAHHAPFRSGKETSIFSQALATRKRILDAKWILAGKGILALLDDGHWGIWASSDSTRPGRSIEDFAIEGHLGASISHDFGDTARVKKGSANLAPMTPNTRKAKADQLFSSATRLPGSAARGGISVSPVSSRTGQTDESVVMWYNSDVYIITSIQQFWQGGGVGALRSPGLTHLSDVNTMNENITSISQFAAQTSSAGIGQMNTQRDLLITAEYQAIILQTLRPATPSRQLFQVAGRSAAQDQQMLDAGNLALDDIDNMLNNISSGTAQPTRKVGFAAS